MQTLQLGMGWFAEEPGGLNRFYHDLMAALPEVGVAVRGLVVGDDDVRAASRGCVEPVVPRDRPIVERLRRMRRATRAALARAGHPLVVSHFALYTYPALDLFRGRPLVVHFQGPWALESRAEGEQWLAVRFKRHVETAVYRRATRCIVLSHAFARILHTEYGVPTDRIRVIPGAVDVNRFATHVSRADARERLGWPAERPIVLAVRRLVPRMGLEDLVDAAAEIRRRVPDALILIAGKGPLGPALDARIASLGLADHVRLLGFVPDEQLPLAYRAATVSVVPTVALEGFGLIVAESLAAGTPALVTPVSSLPEVVEELAPALVLASAGAAAIASGVSDALDGTLRLPDAEACARFARERYGWGAVARRVRGVYEEALQA